MQLRKGETTEINLERQGLGGYTWDVALTDNFQVVSTRYILRELAENEIDDPPVGEGSTMKVLIKSLTDEQFFFSARFRRSFVPNDEPIETVIRVFNKKDENS